MTSSSVEAGATDPGRPESGATTGTRSAAPSRSPTYGEYLRLDRILDAQHPRSGSHDEMLFIIQHQTSELWMKLALHELTAARERLLARDMQPAFKMLARVSRVMEQLVHAWDVLATLTPAEYTAMRPGLGTSSGFQSWQYRQIEFLLGNRRLETLEAHRHDPAVTAALEAALAAPSIHDVAVDLLGAAGLLDASALSGEMTGADVASGASVATIGGKAAEVSVAGSGDARAARGARPAPQSDAAIEAAWLAVYRTPARHWDLYQLAEELIDLEDAFRQWRFRHVTTVERIIGSKPGTGGSTGVTYLRRQLDVVLFPHLWAVRAAL